MTHTPTPQQLTIYEAATNPHGGNLAISALAGTGKTTTDAQLARRLPGSGLATSVMRSTTADLAKVMPSNWSTIGMHALGYRAIKKKMPNTKLDKNGTILYEFCKEAFKNEKEGWWKVFADVKPLVEQAQLAGIVPDHEKFALADTEANWEEIANRFDLEWSPLIYSTARAALQHLNREALKGNITFTHMLTLPLFWSFPVDQFPKIIVDEAQDLNILQILMCLKALRHNGRLFATGDPNQSIMAFAGSLPNSFYDLVDQFNCQVLPLTWCWRCGSEIIDVARQYVPDLEAPPGAHTGAVQQVDYIDLGDLPHQIIVRNNAPGAKLAMRLFAAGYSVEVAGRDIGAGLKSTIKRVASGKNANNIKSPNLMSRLRAWADREIERRPARQPAIRDKLEAIASLATCHSTIGSILKHLDNLYVNEQDGKRRPAQFQISTIHKAKGREWDRVGFLDPHLIPSKWAKKDRERQQERNLAYVATTRPKHELIYLNSEMIQ